MDLAEWNAKAKSYEDATVWRFPRRKLAIGAAGPPPLRTNMPELRRGLAEAQRRIR